jgi:hypothetical protein
MTTAKSRKPRPDNLRDEYDFGVLARGVRGKYFRRASAGTNLVLLDPDVARTFRDSRSVNEALRLLANLAKDSARASRTAKARHG